jgi:23S rRNA pseudouridine2605 synthase
MRGNEKKEDRKVGLARALSKLGYCSRSRAGELIRAGRVRLNGATPRDPERPVRIGKDRITVDGTAVRDEKGVYLMLNKPRGVVTTAADEKGRKTVYEHLPEGLPWVSPVGRLDKASEGLLLLTNDSEWAAQVTAPERHVDKTYHVQVAGEVGLALREALTRGLRTKEGEMLRAKSVEILRAGEKNTWVVVALDEGKNRQIRRMFEAVGMEVLRLVRVAIGTLALGELAKGSCRALSASEKQELDRALGVRGQGGSSTGARQR